MVLPLRLCSSRTENMSAGSLEYCNVGLEVCNDPGEQTVGSVCPQSAAPSNFALNEKAEKRRMRKRLQRERNRINLKKIKKQKRLLARESRRGRG